MARHQQARDAGQHLAGTLPAKSPELNPVENVWQYLRQTWLSNRVFLDYEAILDACCRAWKIMSIGLRE